MCEKKVIPVEDAVGTVLAHDITEIRRGEFKGPAFKKGHVIRPDDVCRLQRLGKRHLHVLKIEEDQLHEDEAAEALANAFCGEGVIWKEAPREGKISLLAARDGLFVVDVAALEAVNLVGELMCATRHTHFVVREGDTVAALRAIPLVIESSVVQKAVHIAKALPEGLLRVKPLRRARAGLVITGHEVYHGLVQDQFEPVLQRKVTHLGSEILETAIVPDDADLIAENIRKLLSRGADLVLVTGGMSVDPDDVTRVGIDRAGASQVIYGAPVLPGAMFLLAHIGPVPILGVPACGLYHETTILDLILPRILAGDRITRADIAALGHGGLCLNCKDCRFPVCPLGKGSL